MKITFRKDISLMDNEIIICANKSSPAIEAIINQLSDSIATKKLKGRHGDDLFLLDFTDIYSFRIEDRILYAYTENKAYTVSAKLYEIKSQTPNNFIQISKSEIINSDYIHYLELGTNGIIKINFINTAFTHSSRRYLKNIKEHLNL